MKKQSNVYFIFVDKGSKESGKYSKPKKAQESGPRTGSRRIEVPS
jgi:hypothetical protein